MRAKLLTAALGATMAASEFHLPRRGNEPCPNRRQNTSVGFPSAAHLSGGRALERAKKSSEHRPTRDAIEPIKGRDSACRLQLRRSFVCGVTW